MDTAPKSDVFLVKPRQLWQMSGKERQVDTLGITSALWATRLVFTSRRNELNLGALWIAPHVLKPWGVRPNAC